MYLQLNWTDPETSAPHPQAALVIDDARAHLAANQADLGISIYASATAAAPASQKGPVFRDRQVVLTPAEVDQLRQAFVQQLYQILQARPQYAGATLVTP